MSDTRSRTLQHMRVLLGTAAASAVVSACSGSGSSGYAVVDPMPAPARCAGNPPQVTASAQIVAAGDGSPEILLIVGAMPNETKYIDQAPQATNGTVTSWRLTDTGLEVRLRGSGIVTVVLALSCADGPGKLQAVLNVNASPEPGQQVPTQLSSAD